MREGTHTFTSGLVQHKASLLSKPVILAFVPHFCSWSFR